MAAVWMRARADVRRHWTGILAVAILAGIAGGVVMTAVAGARRTDSTLARVVGDERVPDVMVNPDLGSPSAYPQAWAAIGRLPNIAVQATVDGVVFAPFGRDGKPDFDAAVNEVDLAIMDEAVFRDRIDDPHVVSGRMFDPTRADEVMINLAKARRDHLEVGDHIRGGVYAAADLANANPADPSTLPKPRFVADVTVTGIVLPFDDATRAPDDPHLNSETLFTPAFDRKLSGFDPPYFGKEVRLVHGAADVPTYEAGVRRVFRGVTIENQGQRIPVNMNFQEPANLTAARARRAIRPYVLALWLFAALAALAALAVIGQAISRNARPLREERHQLRALGFTRREVFECAGIRGLVIGVVGALLALAIAVLASPLMPIGPLRAIDPQRGVQLDAVPLLGGAALIILLVVLAAVLAVRPRRRPSNRTAARIGEGLAHAGTPVTVVSGVRFAFDRGRDGSVPLWSTLVGITVAIAALIATLVYGAGLTRFTDTPTRYGWPWSYQVTVDDSTVSPNVVARKLAATPGVGGFTAGYFSQFDVHGTSVAAVAIAPKPGVPTLPILSGHAPVADDEIVLGEKTMQTLHTHLGATLPVTVQSQTKPFRVVGTAVFPRFAPYPGSEPTGLGIGAATTARAVEELHAQNGSPFFLVNVRRGQLTSPGALARALGETNTVGAFGAVLGPQRPNDVLSYQHLATTPLVLAGVLVLLGLGSAIHLLVTGVRGRRRDVALLKTMGISRGQAQRAVLIQATVLVALALVVAMPLGLVTGRWLWRVTATWLGIAADPRVPVVALLTVAAVALVLANLIAFVPAVVAARARPAVALRAE